MLCKDEHVDQRLDSRTCRLLTLARKGRIDKKWLDLGYGELPGLTVRLDESY